MFLTLAVFLGRAFVTSASLFSEAASRRLRRATSAAELGMSGSAVVDNDSE